MAMRKYDPDTLATTRLWGELIGGPNDILTGDDLAQLPDDPFRYELLQGRLLRMPPPQDIHALIAAQLSYALVDYNKRQNPGGSVRGECGYLLSMPGERDTVFGPDVSYMTPGRPRGLKKGAYRREAPDLAVEIVSPSQFKPEMYEKARLYMAAGVRLLWLIWPATQTIEVWHGGHEEPVATLGLADILEGRDVLPDFATPLRDIFPAESEA